MGALAVVCAGLAGIAGACSIDDSGQSGDGGADVIGQDVTGQDVVGQDAANDVAADVPLPPSCTTIDVSCLSLDGGVPDGWAPYVAEPDGGPCPSSDFTASPWVANAHLAPGSCTCSCTAAGSWSCDGTITVTNGGACGNSPFITVDSGACVVNPTPSSHLELLTDASVFDATSNGVACTPDASAGIALSESVTLCAGACDAGPTFCAQPPGTRCIAADGVQPCPPTFTQSFVGASATAACNACTCTPSGAPSCTATGTVFYGAGATHNLGCSTLGMFTSETQPLDGSCQSFAGNYDSLEATWNALPAPTCAPAAGGGTANLTPVKTICCK
jgi:hypothetical protein